MKFSVMIAMFLGVTPVAMADGFVCRDLDEKVRVQIYNYVQPEDGTRTAAVMVVSDNTVQHGRKTIARFTAANGTLSSKYEDDTAYFIGDVDLRFSDSSRSGELIGGTRLGELDTITLQIDGFIYSGPMMESGEETVVPQKVEGLLVLKKRGDEGSSILRMNCVRYLKN